MRWWNVVDADGNNHWKFESRKVYPFSVPQNVWNIFVSGPVIGARSWTQRLLARADTRARILDAVSYDRIRHLQMGMDGEATHHPVPTLFTTFPGSSTDGSMHDGREPVRLFALQMEFESGVDKLSIKDAAVIG